MTSAVTNSLGGVSTGYTTSTKPASVTITATSGSLSPLHTHETAIAGPPASIVAIAGNGQTGPASTPLPQNLVVHITDQYGNAVPNASAAFTDGGAGGSFSAVPASTDLSGNASVTYTTPSFGRSWHKCQRERSGR